MTRRPHGLVPNRGGGAAPPRRRPEDRTTYRMSGPLRWVDPEGDVAALHVQDTNSAARSFAGAVVTLDLAGAAISAVDRNGDGERTGLDLLPGEPVTVTARLPRRLVAPPPVVSARRLATHGVLR